MAIYILEEHFMNGTVTLSVKATGIEADSFEEAIREFMKHANHAERLTIHKNDGESFTFSMAQEKDIPYSCSGRIDPEPLRIMNREE